MFNIGSSLTLAHWLIHSSALDHTVFMAAPSSSTDTFNTACASMPSPDSDKELRSAFDTACAAPIRSPDSDKELRSAFDTACAAPIPSPDSDKESGQQRWFRKKKEKQEKKAKKAKIWQDAYNKACPVKEKQKPEKPEKTEKKKPV